ncbi:alginate O-acetyltransferase [Maricurvus nonylphenolicus]|uniref:alginate O-acetyltransferase AlgX-related protein n=1 Tax=Maricurvus nonylphenolicus TaxID=1008307 RepID=UPI0036F2DCEB
MNNNCKKPLLDQLYCVSFAALISGFSVGSLMDFKTDAINEAQFEELITGQITVALEDDYDDHFPLKSLGVNFWSAIDYTVFSEGRPGLVIGEDGWLFSSEEFTATAGAEQSLQQNLAFVGWAKQALARQQIALVVSLVPTKARVLASKLAERKPSLLQRSLYPQLLETLDQQGIVVADGLQAMASHGQAELQFLRNDTHWTPMGAEQVAVNTAAMVEREFGAMHLHRQPFITEISAAKNHQGDLLNFLPLTPWFEGLMPQPDMLSITTTYAQSTAADDLFGDAPNVEIALVGTSYSANPKWNYAGALKQALSMDVENLSMEGEGPMVPMLEFLNTENLDKDAIKLVIWEIPERYMLFDYSPLYASLLEPLDDTDKRLASFNRKQ